MLQHADPAEKLLRLQVICTDNLRITIKPVANISH